MQESKEKNIKEKINKVSVEMIEEAIQNALSFIEDDDLKIVFKSEFSYRRNEDGEEKIHFSTEIGSKPKPKSGNNGGPMAW